MKKVMLVFGTRPEAIKMAPLVNELKRRPSLTVRVCVTGQHKEMLQQVLEVFGIVPDLNLKIMKPGQDLADITSRVLLGMREVLQTEQPDLVLVHGDTTTTFATSLAAFYAQVPVGHVEAGLRTYNLASPFPEEYNRQAVGIAAQYHFAPTQQAQANLLKEGKDPARIYVTGNTAIDALQTTVRPDYHHPELTWVGANRLILLTAHRRENLGAPMHHMFRAIKRIVDETPNVRVIYPIHLNPVVRQAATAVFGDDPRVHLIEPLNVVDFHNFMARADLILTDSGGIQEEAPSLGKPVLVMRDTTERPEGVAAGTLKLVGTTETTIYQAIKQLLTDPAAYAQMSKAANPYGDGHASQRIADVIEAALTK